MYRKVRAKTKKTFAPPDKKSSMDMTTRKPLYFGQGTYI